MRPVGQLDTRSPRLRRLARVLRHRHPSPRRAGRRPLLRSDTPTLDAMLRQVNGEPPARSGDAAAVPARSVDAAAVPARALVPPPARRSDAAPDAAAAPDDERSGAERRGDHARGVEPGRAGERPDRDGGRFGPLGRPISRGHPFYVGFVGAIGVLVAIGLVRLLGDLSGLIILLVVSAFLALGLAPVVDSLTARGLRRPVAVGTVYVGVLAVFAGFVSMVIPIAVAQATELASVLPGYVTDAQAAVERSPTLTRFDAEYGVTERLASQLKARLASGEAVSMVFGGIFGAGRAVVSGVFSTVTVLVLTLYFLGSMNHIKTSGYALVPRSRRHRVQLLGDEITRRIGGYVIGQITIATINALCSYLVLSLLSIPYAAVLALVVGVLGLIPLVGATLGALVVVVVALFTSVTSALVLAVYFLVYQQLENYLLAPRVMQRAVAVPGAVAIVAALAGGSLLGILGALIAIPLAAAVLLVVQEVVVPRQDRS